MSPRVALAAAVLAAGVAATACAGSGADKAGGQEHERAATTTAPVGKPVTLTLVTVDDTWASEYAAAASRLSGGSVRIRTRIGGNWLLDYEGRLVGDVRAGKADLASVGARAWDRLGVTSFQGLVAPLLVDSLPFQERILTGGRVGRMLAGVERLGLVGLAVLPGVLRRPLGVTRTLAGPEDYAGATVGIRLGRVADASVKALGGRPKPYRIGALGRVDGAELDVATIVNNGYDKGARALTANVVLWARPETIVIGRRAFMRLAPAQREVLRRAGREAVAPVRARIERDERQALEALCGRGAVRLAVASASDLTRLRAAVQPVYRLIERDAFTKGVIAEIRSMKRGVRSDPLHCAGAAVGVAALAGRWAATDFPPGRRTATLELDDGRWTARVEPHHVWSGSYAVVGPRIRLSLERCSDNPCDPGVSGVYRWSVYRDTLSLEPVGNALPWPPDAVSWRRAP